MNLDSKTFFSYSILDADRAFAFYQDTLGVDARIIPMGPDMKIVELNLAGNQSVMLYEKKDHVPATFTVLNFEVNDIDQTVKELSQKGILFEHYKGSDEAGIMRNDGPQIAWFKDPDGNFLSVIQEERVNKFEDEYAGEAPQSPS